MLQYQVPERRQTDVRLHDSKDQRIIMRNYEINSSNKETGADYSLWITQQITHTVCKVQFLKQAFEKLCFLRSLQNIWVPPPCEMLVFRACYYFGTKVHIHFYIRAHPQSSTSQIMPELMRLFYFFLLPKVCFAFQLKVVSAQAELMRQRGQTRVSQLKGGR